MPPEPFLPETVANLAVQLLKLRPEQLHSEPTTSRGLSDPHLDSCFQDALKRAEFMLKSAAGESDEVVHAYQLFSEGAEPLSFEDVAKRFKEVGWTKRGLGRNTLEDLIRELIVAANEGIQSKLEGYLSDAGRNTGYPVSFENIQCRIQRHIHKMINWTGLRDLVPDSWEIGEKMSEHFLHLITSSLRPHDVGSAMEKYESIHGYSTFLKYVCNGLSFEKFMAKSNDQVVLNSDRMGTLIFFFEELASMERISTDEPKHIEILIRLIGKGGDIPQDLICSIEECRGQLQMESPDIKEIKNLAKGISSRIRGIHEKQYLEKLDDCQPLAELKQTLQKWSSWQELFGFDNYLARAATLIELLGSGKPGEAAEASRARLGHISEQCIELRKIIFDTEGLSNLMKQPADLLERVSRNLNRGLNPPQLKIMDRREMLERLIEDLSPYSGPRLVRPFEIFLFAAQRGLLRDRLTDRLSDPNSGFIPYPKRQSHLPILWAHKGAVLPQVSDASDS
jgi:hypothetical protein